LAADVLLQTCFILKARTLVTLKVSRHEADEGTGISIFNKV